MLRQVSEVDPYAGVRFVGTRSSANAAGVFPSSDVSTRAGIIKNKYRFSIIDSFHKDAVHYGQRLPDLSEKPRALVI